MAVLEGVAFSLADGQAALEAAGTRLIEATLVGGGGRSRFWAGLVAAACGFALVRPQSGDLGGAFGAARLARCRRLYVRTGPSRLNLSTRRGAAAYRGYRTTR